ncbi:MAG: glycosyltransferase family 39 protein [Pseudolabrys sp.]|nr:glycosyltransferase family 39 protein [Pseudolabrys sp.]MBV9260272.1 glycosyltransferase family 39 protein [Pseudolabrys sp.]
MWADRVAFAVLSVELIIIVLTFRDYGLGWDDYTHSQYGDLLLSLYGSGFSDQRVFKFVNLYFYGGGFDMAAALFAKLSSIELFEARRLVGAVIGVVGLATTWRLGRRLGGPLAGLLALLLLATCPLFDGHMYINAKDAPFATAMVILLYAVVRVLQEYPEPSRLSTAIFGLGLGLAFGSRILAAVLAPCAVAAICLIVVQETRTRGKKDALTRLLQFGWQLVPALLVGYLIMGLLWPWSILTPLNPILASEYFANFFEKPWRELYEGRLISVPDMPASYLPHLFSLKLPEIMLGLGFAGAVGAAAVFWEKATPPRHGAQLFLVMLAAFFPVALAIVARPALYNGLRHFIFVVPPFAILGGLAGAALFNAIRPHGHLATSTLVLIFIVGIALPISDIVRLHPFQYTAFNWISGGVRMAHRNYMLDYWGLAFKQTGESLRKVVEEKHFRHPAGRRWVVEICGPQPPADIALGRQFETTWDRKTADFAMMLGTYYCRDDIKAPILVEVRREGVLYGRVYDLRGQAVPNLLTVPPPQ